MADFSDCHEVAAAALRFQRQYYSLMDNMEQRANIVNLFPDGVEPLMEWNGHALVTKADVAQYFSSLPPTSHKVECLDAQPLPGNVKGDTFMMTASGKVIYGGEHTRFFYHRIILRSNEENKHFILNDYFRWTGES